jgi:hypothetical protein
MAAWLKIDDIVQPWSVRMVHSELEASRLNVFDAREATAAARKQFGDYRWVLSHITTDIYVVVGLERPKAVR